MEEDTAGAGASTAAEAAFGAVSVVVASTVGLAAFGAVTAVVFGVATAGAAGGAVVAGVAVTDTAGVMEAVGAAGDGAAGAGDSVSVPGLTGPAGTMAIWRTRITPYYSDYPYPDYSTNPCYPYGPYGCTISGSGPENYGPASYAPESYPTESYAPDPARSGQGSAAYPQMTPPPVATNPYVADGKWHSFSPPPAPAGQAHGSLRQAAAPSTAPQSPQGQPAPGQPDRAVQVTIADGQWHHFGVRPAPAVQFSTRKLAPQSAGRPAPGTRVAAFYPLQGQ